jgi:ABC-type uncharacterized transport system auxiliary subunit
MTNRATTFACLTLAVLVIAGCAGKVHYPDYYMLSIAPSEDPSSAGNHKLSAVAVQRFETPAYLRQGRIVYRQTPEQIGFYDYHRWASDPGQVVTGAMMDRVRSAGVFSFVEAYDGQENAEYLLSGRLERLDEVDYKNGVQVEVKLSAQLVNRKTGAVVWTGDRTTTTNVSQREVSSVVRAMDQATQKSVEQLVGDMKKQLAATLRAAEPSGVSAENKALDSGAQQ